MCRVRQIIEVIKERKSVKDVNEKLLIDWQTRTIASFLAALPFSAETSKEMAKSIDTISLFAPKDGTSIKSSSKPLSLDHLESGPGSVPEPNKGSTERLMMMFGGGGRRPGKK